MYWVGAERKHPARNTVIAVLTCAATVVLLVVNLLLAGAMWNEREALVAIREADMAASASLYGEYRDRYDEVTGLSLWLALPRYLALGLAIIWFRRAYRNLKLYNLAGWREARVGVVWSWLIPGVNFVRPLLLMQMVWRASGPRAVNSGATDAKWRRLPGSRLVYVTWVAIVAGYFVGWLPGLFAWGDPESLSFHINRSSGLLMVQAVRVLALLLAMWVVVEVTARQRTAARLLTAERPAEASTAAV